MTTGSKDPSQRGGRKGPTFMTGVRGGVDTSVPSITIEDEEYQ